MDLRTDGVSSHVCSPNGTGWNLVEDNSVDSSSYLEISMKGRLDNYIGRRLTIDVWLDYDSWFTSSSH